MALFESYERRIDNINKVLNANGIASIEEAQKICADKGIDPYKIVKEIQPICFENAAWAYVVGAALAIKRGCKTAADAAAINIPNMFINNLIPVTIGNILGGAIFVAGVYYFIFVNKKDDAISEKKTA